MSVQSFFRFFVRWLAALAFLAIATAGVVYLLAGRAAPPQITIHQPSVLGRAGTLDVTVEAPDARIDALTVHLEQNGRTFPVFDLGQGNAGSLRTEAAGPAGKLRLTHPIGKQNIPELQAGQATVVVAASRPVLRGLRRVSADARREVPVRLEPPRLSVVSTHHFINLGGAEMIVYRVTPPEAASGVRVGELTYPGFAVTGTGGDPSLKLAFFVLLHDQPQNAPMELYAKDAAGNEARAAFDHRVFLQQFKRSRIELDDAFLSRVVPAIARQSPELETSGSSGSDLLPTFLKINNELRRRNAETIAGLAARTAPVMLWRDAFRPLTNSQVESGFADYRSYFYRGKEVDQQVHLGFDLARTANVPILAANHGKVLYATDLGIYGNTVILDHGQGVQSLYAHLSAFEVSEGREVRRDQIIGRSGQTGLAGGDHLHFSMLVNGRFVDATEWWDPHWIEDRILRKLRESGVPVPTEDDSR